MGLTELVFVSISQDISQGSCGTLSVSGSQA